MFKEFADTVHMTVNVPDLTKPSARGLIYLLRNPHLWPEGFYWYYGSRRTCAIGLMEAYWSSVTDPSDHCPQWAEMLGITFEECWQLFIDQDFDITSCELSDLIEKVIETR